MTRLSFYAAAALLIVVASGAADPVGVAGAASLAVLPLVPPYRVVRRPEVRL